MSKYFGESLSVISPPPPQTVLKFLFMWEAKMFYESFLKKNIKLRIPLRAKHPIITG